MAECVFQFPATFDAYVGAAEALKSVLDEHSLEERLRYKVELVFEELVTNVIRHSASRHVSPSVEVRVDFGQDHVLLNIQDDGRPFDPRQYEIPEPPASLEEASIGGLGIMLVRTASDEIHYERTREHLNHLTVKIAA